MATTRSAAARLGTAAAVLAGVAVVTGVGLSIVYVERRAIGLRLATDYLRARGVPATLRIDRLDPGGFAGALVLGPARDPDLSVERVEIEFARLQLGLAGLTPPRVRAIRLYRPVLKARLDDHGLHFGSLQRLIDETPRGGAAGPAPDVTFVAGRLRLDTFAGAIRLDADGALRQGRVVSLSARLPSTDLDGVGLGVRKLEGDLRLVTHGDRLDGTWRFVAADVRMRDGRARDIEADGEAVGPYPGDPAHVRGRLVLAAEMRTGELGARDATARGAVARLQMSGEIAVGSRAVAFDGDAGLALTAAAMRLASAALGSPAVTLEASQAKLAYVPAAGGSSGPRLATPLDLQLSVAQIRDPAAPGLVIRDGRTVAHGRLRLSSAGLGLDLRGGAELAANFAVAEARRLALALPEAAGEDLRGVVAANLRGARVRAGDYRLTVKGPRLELRLGAPVRADFAAGAALAISPHAPGPVLTLTRESRHGAFDLRLTGPKLPAVDLRLARWSSEASRAGPLVDVESAIDVAGDAGPLRGGFLHARARIADRGGALTVVEADCGDFGFATFGAGAAPTLRAVRARICPITATPLLDLRQPGWSVAGRLVGLQALAPGAGVAVFGGDGTFALHDGGGRGALELAQLRVADTVKPTRFRPVAVAGAAALAAGSWTGALRLGLEAASSPFGRLTFAYDPKANAGDAHFTTTGLRFAAHGLQPSSFAPMAAQWASALEGPLTLDADVAWAGARVTSHGEIRTSGLDLQTAAGRVHGLEGDVSFSSLYPLATSSVQRLHARALDTAIPMSDLAAEFEVGPKRLTLRRAEASLAGGRIALDPLGVPLSAAPDFSGAVRLDHVDFGAVLATLGLADSVSLQAKMSGALPFSVRSGALSVSAGRLAADGPGRLTIRREALGGAVTTAGAAGAQPNAVQDFAYQALENLAFDALDAEVASLPKGRLGVVLHVHGRHDPATAIPTRVRLIDLVAGHAFDKPLPLPKGTGVELTLDTSLNLDELLADYGALRTTAGSAGVQPPAPR